MDSLADGIRKDIEVSAVELNRLKSDLKNSFNNLKNPLNQMKEKVKTLHGHLYGGQEGNVEADAFDLAGQFKTRECKNVLSNSSLSQVKGLNGVEKLIEGTMLDQATEYNSQRDTIEGDTEKLYKKIQGNIKKFGISNILSGDQKKLGLLFEGTQDLTQFKDVQTLVGTEIRSITELTSKNKKLASKYKPGKKFERNFQDKFVTNCVTGEDGSSFGMSADEFIKGLNFPQSLRGGNTQQNAEAAIRDIFGHSKKGKILILL